MTNEELILARLDALTEEVRQAKQAVRPYLELKEDLKPLINDAVIEMIARLGGMDRRFNIEDIGEMIGQLLISGRSISDALKTLNKMMEFKQDFEPYSKEVFNELINQLQTTLQGFEGEKLQELLKQFIVNMGNLADSLHMIGVMMEFRRDASALAKPAFNDIAQRLECLKQRGVFDAFEQVLGATERVGAKMQEIDFSQVEPVRGIFGLMAALKRPEVQEGLGVLIELSTVMTGLKEQTPSATCTPCRAA